MNSTSQKQTLLRHSPWPEQLFEHVEFESRSSMVNLRRLLNSLLELLRNALNFEEESSAEAGTGSGGLDVGELSQLNAVSFPADTDDCMIRRVRRVRMRWRDESGRFAAMLNGGLLRVHRGGLWPLL